MPKIIKLPPGEAFGARDLQNWSNNRALGSAGSYNLAQAKKQRKKARKLSKASGYKVKEFR